MNKKNYIILGMKLAGSTVLTPKDPIENYEDNAYDDDIKNYNGLCVLQDDKFIFIGRVLVKTNHNDLGLPILNLSDLTHHSIMYDIRCEIKEQFGIQNPDVQLWSFCLYR
jgi:hypothetical protein